VGGLFFIIIFLIVIAILGITKPQLIIWILFVGGFLGIVAVNIYIKGFPKGLIEGLGYGVLFLIVYWSAFQQKFNAMFSARALLEPKSSRASNRIKSSIFCGKCKTKLLYDGKPKNFSQFMWGRRTYPNCGAELYSNGKVVSK
jgi:hypothetical protein